MRARAEEQESFWKQQLKILCILTSQEQFDSDGS
jgi:hypothetical protein